MRITAVTCVKNEAPFLLEWIAFHRLIGVTDFLFYSNDCADGTDRLLDALASRYGLTGAGIVHRPNPAQGRNYQMEALKQAARQPVVQNADWVWVADVDEFPNIHVGNHDLPDLITACGTPQAISLSYQFFGNGGVARFVDRPVIAQFTTTHNPDIWTDQTAIEVKTLLRADLPVQYFGAHRPFLRQDRAGAVACHWTDGSGRAVPDAFLYAQNKRRIRKFPAHGARQFATLNHYALRSQDSYLIKQDRGDVNREHRAFDDTYWRERNDAAWQDSSIQRHLPALQATLDRWKADPDICALHKAAVQWHRNRAETLRRQPSGARTLQQLAQAHPLPPGEEELRRQLGYRAWGARA